MEKTLDKVVILAGSDIESYEGVKKILQEDEFIICADSGYEHCKKLNIIPDLLIGDFDSISEIPKGIDSIAFSKDKDFTDTDLAIAEAEKRGAKTFTLIGMLGGRVDHSMSNMQVMFGLAKKGYKVCMQDGQTSIHAYYSADLEHYLEILLPFQKDCYFSVVSFSDSCQDVTISGGKYPLENYTLTNTRARAVSNEFVNSPVKISFHSGMLMTITTKKSF